ncbi:MAG TPA: hypothetical protein ENK06_01010, partial [Gammaproteobacteria bacterium]|nr:hypothetical protein [Gammaproteobacteria bacterium]
AQATDNLYVFVFKNGQAQSDIEIKVGNLQRKTNEFGLANFSLSSGEYQVGYYKNRELFALTDIHLLKDQQSQIFLELTQDGAQVELDLPLDAYKQDFQKTKVSPQTGPKGTLQITVIDSKTKKPVPGVRLFFRGYAVEGIADKDGVARLDLSQESYDISLIHPKYLMQALKDVKIVANQTTKKTLALVQANIMLDEFVVTAPSVEGSLASTLTALKESNVIGDALSSEEFTKSGDSSAADALKRVTGITIVGGKYVYVRGLGERYSVVMLNDLYIPSPEPTKRVVPLDIIPSGVIQSMNIQKTYSTDLPGTFAGGDVLIATKDIPEKDNYIKLGVSSSVNRYTGKSVYFNADNKKGLPADVIDKSANFQPLQQGFPGIGVPGYTAEELQNLNSAIANYRQYNLQKSTLKPGYKIAVDVGQSFKTSGGIKYGFVGTLYTGEEGKSKEATKYSSFYNIPTDELIAGEKSSYQQTTVNGKTGGLLSLVLDNPKGQKIKYSFLRLYDKQNTTTFSEKDGGPKGPGVDDQQRTYYEYVKKGISVHQLSGEHRFAIPGIKNDLFNDIKIKWAAEKASATRLEPGTVEFTYEKTSDETDFTLNKKIWYLYSDLKDEVENYRVDMTLPYRFQNKDNATYLGFFSYAKSRMLDNRRFKVQHSLGTDVFEDIDRVFTQDNAENGDLVLTSNYRPADAYKATQNVTAFYLKQLLSVRRDTDILAGIRQENSTQQLIDTESGVPYEPLTTHDTLMSLGINYRFNEENKIRMGYSGSLSRPDFREFSPNRYKDPITEDIVFGYPDLKYTTISNLDIKYDWYMSYDEVFSFGLFQKNFTNPVETIVNQDPDSQSGKKIISYRNALGATSRGFEISLRKKLNFISPNYFVSSNFSYIYSRIKLEQDSSDIMIKELSTRNRSMQGQSSYVINVNMGYDNLNTGRSILLVYNEFGKRITALGSYGAPDYYEYPFRKLDFVVKWQLNDTHNKQMKKIAYGLGLKLSNILDSTAEVRQGDVVIETYKPGLGFNLSFSAKY